jgi:hypothetical protein
VADEGRCAASSSPSFDPADAAHGFRSAEFVAKMSYQDVQLTGLDRADLFAQLDQFFEAEKA